MATNQKLWTFLSKQVRNNRNKTKRKSGGKRLKGFSSVMYGQMCLGHSIPIGSCYLEGPRARALEISVGYHQV